MHTPRTAAFALLILIATTAAAFAPAQADERASTDCPSGYFCAWSGAGYTGPLRKVSTPDTYHQLNLASVKSYYNRYSKRAWLHATSDGSGTYACISSGAKNSNVTGWQAAARSVWLSTTTNC